MRSQGFENLCITGKIEGTRARGRQRLTFLESSCRHMELQMSPIELLKYTEDRALWKSVVIDVTHDRTLDDGMLVTVIWLELCTS